MYITIKQKNSANISEEGIFRYDHNIIKDMTTSLIGVLYQIIYLLLNKITLTFTCNI